MNRKSVVLASGNSGKLKEFRQMLEPLGWSVLSPAEAGIQLDAGDVEEIGLTFRDNALIKAKAYAGKTELPVLADDSGLEVVELQGAPGVHSARFAGPEASDAENRAKLMELLHIHMDRTAKFVCVLCWLEPGEEQHPNFFSGECEGKIALTEQGQGGFGYDRLFIPEGYEQTFAELPSETKDRMSHRGKALESLLEFLGTR